MYGDVIKKIVLIGGMAAALLCLASNLMLGHDLANAAYRALWVMLTVAILLHVIMRAIAHVLMRFLDEQRRQAQLASGDSNEPASAPVADKAGNVRASKGN